MMWGGPQMAGMSDHAIAERRQRNREHAKRSRVRKKFMLESLQEQVAGLQRENQRLRLLVQDNIPEHAQQIISECCSSSPLFSDDEAAKRSQLTIEDEKGEKSKSTALVRSDFQLMDSLSAGQQNFVLSDPRLPDNPIVFATPGFYKLTGYTPEQVLGRNCRFLQGPGTDPKTVDIIRKAIATGSDCTVCILNYKADGTPFWNQFFVAALRDSDNCIVNYVSDARSGNRSLLLVGVSLIFLLTTGWGTNRSGTRCWRQCIGRSCECCPPTC
jgi:PAS domain S-box-containing protein